MKKIIFFFSLLIICFACEPEDYNFTGKITTNDVTDITSISAMSGGTIDITSKGGSKTISRKGLIWGTEKTQVEDYSTAVRDGNVTDKGLGTNENFTCALTGLTPDTRYYIRAFVKIGESGNEFICGDVKEFMTAKAELPSVSTQSPTDVDETTATFHGTIISVGDPAYTERGFVYSASAATPAIGGNGVTKAIVSGSSAGDFMAAITGLTAKTTYYIRAYVTNPAGTAYGSVIKFTTTTSAPAPTQEKAQVRFEKDKAYLYMTDMVVVSADVLDEEDDDYDIVDYILAWHEFGEESGTSPYYEIPAGAHYVLYYYAYPGEEDAKFCFDSPYNFQAGRRYTVVCSHNGNNFTFQVTNDGSYTPSSISVSTTKTTTKTIKISKKSLQSKSNRKVEVITNK
ncbi:MAG: hypothetical protein LBK45_05850 [Tannerellaceae bacterium]|jgi:hypothetical protein|nr:hypothetical protein [Tannerellaceae bacterium]